MSLKYIFAFGVYFYFFLSVLYVYCIIHLLSCLNLFLAIFVALVEWDVLKSRSPMMYRKTLGFCILLSCPAALLNLMDIY